MVLQACALAIARRTQLLPNTPSAPHLLVNDGGSWLERRALPFELCCLAQRIDIEQDSAQTTRTLRCTPSVAPLVGVRAFRR
jgi:hypothetical protein